MTEYTESFEKVPLFVGLAPTEIQDLLRIAEDIEAKKSDTVVLQDTPGDGFYIISAGAFEVLKSGNRNEVLGRLERMSFFGEPAVCIAWPSIAPRAWVSIECVRLRASVRSSECVRSHRTFKPQEK